MGNGKIKILLRSLLLSYILTGILLLLLSFALYKFRLKENQVVIAVHVIYVLTCLIGGFLVGKGIRQRRFFWGMMSGLLYFSLLLAVSYLMNRSLGSGTEQILTTLGICAFSGTVGGMFS